LRISGVLIGYGAFRTGMGEIRIVCTEQTPITNPTNHAHITAVGVDTTGNGEVDHRHALQTVVSAIDNNIDVYYTYGENTRKVALVETIPCPVHCGETIIRSAPDAVTDNNLDSLRRCNWK